MKITSPSDHGTARPTMARDRAEDRVRQERLLELATFLRDCRSRAEPDGALDGPKRRRRISGLSREEVARRAGISTDWYVRIEQGRDVRPSPQVLCAIALALQMTPAERRHLFTLAAGQSADRIGPPTDAVALTRIADQMPATPAIVLDRRWTVLAQNRPAVDLWTDWTLQPAPLNNFLYRFFTDPTFTDQLEDWDRHAQLAIRQYRPVFAREMHDERVRGLIQQLCGVSTTFSKWWAGANVAGRDDGRKVFRLATGERRAFDYVMLRHSESDESELVVFMPTEPVPPEPPG